MAQKSWIKWAILECPDYLTRPTQKFIKVGDVENKLFQLDDQSDKEGDEQVDVGREIVARVASADHELVQNKLGNVDVRQVEPEKSDEFFDNFAEN